MNSHPSGIKMKIICGGESHCTVSNQTLCMTVEIFSLTRHSVLLYFFPTWNLSLNKRWRFIRLYRLVREGKIKKLRWMADERYVVLLDVLETLFFEKLAIATKCWVVHKASSLISIRICHTFIVLHAALEQTAFTLKCAYRSISCGTSIKILYLFSPASP